MEFSYRHAVYKSYQHIEKLGSSEVDGILNGTCYLSYKIDGTNGCVFLKEDGNLGYGSRTRELSTLQDNQGFMNTLSVSEAGKDLHAYLLKHPTYIVYGEWLVCGTLKTYKEDARRHFYVFDVYDTEADSYINFDVYSKDFDSNYKNITYIPLIAKLVNPTEEEVKSYLDKTGDFLITVGLGEGLVIKNYEYKNRFGRATWAKMLTEDYKATKLANHTGKQGKPGTPRDNAVEEDIIKLMTYEHIFKEKNKIMESHQSETWEAKFIMELLNRAYNEFWKDNWEQIILKKIRGSTVNFGVLKKLSDTKVKVALGLIKPTDANVIDK